MADWELTDEQVNELRKKTGWTGRAGDIPDCTFMEFCHRLNQALVKALIAWGEQPCKRHIVPSVGGTHPARRFDCPYCMLQLKQEVNDPHT